MPLPARSSYGGGGSMTGQSQQKPYVTSGGNFSRGGNAHDGSAQRGSLHGGSLYSGGTHSGSLHGGTHGGGAVHCGPSVNDPRLDGAPGSDEVAAKLAWHRDVVKSGPWPAPFLQPGIDQSQACFTSSCADVYAVYIRMKVSKGF